MEFGPEIKVDGKRPQWLEDDEVIDVEVKMYGWFSALDISGLHVRDVIWPPTRFIRLPANHPHYITPTPDERAVAPELAKHMLDSWEAMAKVDPKDVGPHFAANWIETAKGIVAEAENPDITEVRSLLEGMHGASDEDIALAALARGRQLEKEGK